MSRFSVVIHPQNKRVEIEKGETLLEAIFLAGITLNNLCGGEGICKRCKVIVKEGDVSFGLTDKLTGEEIKKGYVLACHSYIHSDITVEIPEETLAKEKNEANKGAERFKYFEESKEENKEFKFSPLVKKVYLELEKPTLVNNIADHQNLCGAINQKLKLTTSQIGLEIIRSLPGILRDNDYKITLTVGFTGDSAKIINIEGKNTEEQNYTIVVDIGTTTVVAHLVNAAAHKTINAKACFNSQGIYGRDVTGRIISAEKNGHEKLQALIINDINNLIGNLINESGISLNDVSAVVCAGNTVMMHFLLGLPANNIRRNPYVAASIEPPAVYAAEAGIKINPRGLLYSLPGISAWVGSDITAGILACEIYKKDEISLLVDIGTNGEVVIGNKEWLIATSASAGPSLEGASVECGMRAEEGAVEKIYVHNNELLYKAIGDAPVKGICGSGIIDFIAALLNENIINRSGKFIEGGSDRITCINGIRRFTLIDNDDNSKSVYLTENDIENVIIAKAAIYSAVRILLKRLSLSLSDIKRLYICGAFGNYIKLESAIAIGLIPNISAEKIEFAGNTAIKGAKMSALNKDFFYSMQKIREMTTYYDLIGADDYIEEFKKAIFLPHTNIEEFAVFGNGVKEKKVYA